MKPSSLLLVIITSVLMNLCSMDGSVAQTPATVLSVDVEQPTHVAPKTSTVTVGDSFDQASPAYSLTVIRFA